MYFPVFIDLTEKEILVVGAGTIAARRIRTLCEFAGHLTVVAPSVCEEVGELAASGQIRLVRRRFEQTDLDGRDMVLAATDDAALNRMIADSCRERKLPVNVCSDQTLCDFQFPSIVQSDAVVIGINASGRNHHLVKEVRSKIETCLNIEKGLYRE